MARPPRVILSGVEIPRSRISELARERAQERGISYKNARRSLERYFAVKGRRDSASIELAQRLLPGYELPEPTPGPRPIIDLSYVLIYEYDGEVDDEYKIFDAYANYRTREDAVASGEEALGRQDESFVLLLAEAHFRAPGTPYREYNRHLGRYESHDTPESGAWVLHLRWAVKSEPKKPKRTRKARR